MRCFIQLPLFDKKSSAQIQDSMTSPQLNIVTPTYSQEKWAHYCFKLKIKWWLNFFSLPPYYQYCDNFALILAIPTAIKALEQLLQYRTFLGMVAIVLNIVRWLLELSFPFLLLLCFCRQSYRWSPRCIAYQNLAQAL